MLEFRFVLKESGIFIRRRTLTRTFANFVLWDVTGVSVFETETSSIWLEFAFLRLIQAPVLTCAGSPDLFVGMQQLYFSSHMHAPLVCVEIDFKSKPSSEVRKSFTIFYLLNDASFFEEIPGCLLVCCAPMTLKIQFRAWQFTSQHYTFFQKLQKR